MDFKSSMSSPALHPTMPCQVYTARGQLLLQLQHWSPNFTGSFPRQKWSPTHGPYPGTRCPCQLPSLFESAMRHLQADVLITGTSIY